MGYTTEFSGEFTINKPLSAKVKRFIELFSQTRRMCRKVDAVFGIEGEFYVFGEGAFFGIVSHLEKGHEKNVVDCNKPPKTQPGLWCQWTPNEDGTAIIWDGGEKFYNYTEWLVYLIKKVLAPNGYVLNGSMIYQGEDIMDRGTISVENNVVYLDGRKADYKVTEPVLILDGVETPLPDANLKMLSK